MGFFATIGKLFSRIARSRYKAVSDYMEVIVETSSFGAITQQDGGSLKLKNQLILKKKLGH